MASKAGCRLSVNDGDKKYSKIQVMDKENLLANKLERLFSEVHKPDGSKYTQTDVVEGTHGVLTRVYLWKLRTGRAVNPSFQIIQELALFFGVDIDYFSNDGEVVPSPETTYPTGRYIEEIQDRARKLDEKGQKAILDLMDFILSIQKRETHNADDEIKKS